MSPEEGVTQGDGHMSSEEGVTQGDVFAMATYGVRTKPVIVKLQESGRYSH